MFTGKPIYEGKDSEDILWAMKKEKPNAKIEAMKKTENCNPTEFDLFLDLLQSCLVEDQEPFFSQMPLRNVLLFDDSKIGNCYLYNTRGLPIGQKGLWKR